MVGFQNENDQNYVRGLHTRTYSLAFHVLNYFYLMLVKT